MNLNRIGVVNQIFSAPTEKGKKVLTMAEYIEREALEVALNHRLNFLMAENGEYDHYTSGFDEAVTRVENFPAADVAPVVRCKDCRWRGREDCAMFYRCDCGEQHTWETDNDFCSYGEQ